MWLVRSGSISGFEQLVLALGEDAEALLRRFGLNTQQLQNPNTYIPYTQMADLLDYSARVCGDPYFGFRLAAKQNVMVLGEISIVAGQMDTVAEAMLYLMRYLHLHATGLMVSNEIKDEGLQVNMDFKFTNANKLHHLYQLSLGLLYNTVVLPDNTQAYPIIHLRQDKPLLSAANQKGIALGLPEIFFGRVVFSSRFDGAMLPFSILTEKPTYHEADLLAYFDHRVKLLNTLYPENYRSQTQFIISNLLANAACTLERVAEALSLHPRVLQNRLKEEQTSFRAILLDTRKNIAIEQLQHNEIRITDLALSLGYADVSVFSRNFKKWTGVSPSVWRKQWT